MNKKTGFNWWCDKAWIYVGCIISFAMVILTLVNWNTWSDGLKVLAGIAILIPVHVLEEWVFPGGFHYQYNIALYKSDTPKCYPMNRGSDMYTNLVTTIAYAIVTIICMTTGGAVRPGLVLGTVMFCALELIGHTYMGTKMYLKFKNKGKKTIYGPGSITCYWVFVPFGIIGAMWLNGQSLEFIDWIIAFGILAFIAIVCIMIPEGTLKRKDSPYYFESFGYFDRFLKK